MDKNRKKQVKRYVAWGIAVVLVVLLAGVVLWKVVAPGTADSAAGSGTDTEVSDKVAVTFVAKAEWVSAEIYENIKDYIPSQLMASGELYDGWVVAVEKKPYMLLSDDGTWVEDPEHVTLLFTVDANVANEEVMTTLVGTQEIRIGRPGYILKTEYLEFRDTVIVDVQWKNWTPAANRETK